MFETGFFGLISTAVLALGIVLTLSSSSRLLMRQKFWYACFFPPLQLDISLCQLPKGSAIISSSEMPINGEITEQRFAQERMRTAIIPLGGGGFTPPVFHLPGRKLDSILVFNLPFIQTQHRSRICTWIPVIPARPADPWGKLKLWPQKAAWWSFLKTEEHQLWWSKCVTGRTSQVPSLGPPDVAY